MKTFLLTAFALLALCATAVGQSVPLPEVELTEVQKLIAASRPLFHEKKYDEALETLKKALALQPDNHGVVAMMGGIYLAQNKNDLASAQFAKAIALNPNDPQYHLYKAFADKFRRARDEGLLAVRKAIELLPSGAEAYFLMGELLAIGGGNLKERTEAFRRPSN